LKSGAKRPIGIFDSGIGGLTVVKAIRRMLPNENLIYFGDTARVPYGTKSASTVTRFSIENTAFLLKQGVKMAVIACNTSSSLSIDTLRGRFGLPIVGMIEPGARGALSATRNGRIGVIATPSTIKSGAYVKYLKCLDKNIKVFSASCPLFVPLVEEGWLDGKIVSDIAKRYLGPLRSKKIDTLILGCTHYPMLKGVIRAVMGRSVVLVDSGEEAAVTIKRILESSGSINNERSKTEPKFYVSDDPEKFSEVGRRFLGGRLKHVKRIRDGVYA